MRLPVVRALFAILVLPLGLAAGEAPEQVPAPAVATAAAEVWVMPEGERLALRAAVERVLAAGLPDARGGTLLNGPLSYRATKRGGGDYDQQTQGLHVRLADGRLLLNLRRVVPTSGDGAVDTSRLDAVQPADLRALGAQDPRLAKWDPVVAEKQYAAYLAPAEMPKARALLAIRELCLVAQSGASDLALPALALLCMQVPDAELLALSCAINSLWNDIGSDLFAGKATELHLMPVDQKSYWSARNDARRQWKDLVVPAPATVLRQGAIGWFLGRLYGDQQGNRPQAEIVPDLDQAVRGALTLLDDTDAGAATVRELVARLRARADIPLEITADADAAAILAWWDAQRPPKDEDGDEPTFDDLIARADATPVAQRQEVFARAMFLRLRELPLGDLVALAGDPRASRWLDFYRVRTIGDNALRALALRFSCDPRILLGRDAQAPWTAAEQAATVAALRTWWQANQGKPLGELLAAAVGHLPLADIARLVERAQGGERTALLAEVAKHWRATPPADPDPEELARILHAAKAGRQLDAVVVTWPVAGAQRALLAAWRHEHGDETHVDAYLAEHLGAQPVPVATHTAGKAIVVEADAEEGLHEAVGLAAHYPTAARLDRLLGFASDPQATRVEGLFGAFTAFSWRQGPLALWWGEQDSPHLNDDEPDPARRARAAVPLALIGLLLADQRPADADLVSQYEQWNRSDDGKQGKPSADLRIADIASVVLSSLAWNLPFDDLVGDGSRNKVSNLKVDFAAARAARDQVIAQQRALVAAALPLALQAAALPTVIPGVTDPGSGATGDDVPLF